MIAYVVVFILLIIPIYQYRHHQADKSNITYYFVEFIILTFLMGLRYRVGGDSLRYEEYYLYQPSLSELFKIKNWVLEGFQPGWTLLCALCKSISSEFWVLQLTQSLIVNGIIFYCANKYCRYRYSFILIYFLTQYLYFNCEIMREAIAVSIFVFSFKYLVTRNYLKYYTFCTIAFLFHASAIILFILPLLYLFIAKKKGLRLYLTLLITAFCILLLSGLITAYLSTYIFSQNTFILAKINDIGTGSGLNIFGIIGKLLVLSPIIITQYCVTQSNKSDTEAENFILSMYLLVAIVGMFVLPLNRLENYFVIFFLMYFTNFICSSNYRRRLGALIPTTVLIFSISQFIWYYSLVVSNGTLNTEFRKYQRYVPYHSIIDPQKDSEREKAIVKHRL